MYRVSGGAIQVVVLDPELSSSWKDNEVYQFSKTSDVK